MFTICMFIIQSSEIINCVSNVAIFRCVVVSYFFSPISFLVCCLWFFFCCTNDKLDRERVVIPLNVLEKVSFMQVHEIQMLPLQMHPNWTDSFDEKKNKVQNKNLLKISHINFLILSSCLIAIIHHHQDDSRLVHCHCKNDRALGMRLNIYHVQRSTMLNHWFIT